MQGWEGKWEGTSFFYSKRYFYAFFCMLDDGGGWSFVCRSLQRDGGEVDTNCFVLVLV